MLEPEERFAIGQPVPRTEDPILVSGKGRYSDDVSLPGQAYAVMVRSLLCCTRSCEHIDTPAARAMPGVLAIYTAADLAAGGIGPFPARQIMKNRDGTPMLMPIRYALRHRQGAPSCRRGGGGGDQRTASRPPRMRRKAVEVEIDPLPAVTEPGLAGAPGAPLLYDDVPGNVGLDFHYGDSEKVAAAFASAAHVTRARAAQQPHRRSTRSPSRARRSRNTTRRASVDARQSSGCQGVFGLPANLHRRPVLGVGRDKVRILTDRVGGSFGMKQATYAEYFLHPARGAPSSKPPVKWTDERSGSFVSDSHGRDHEMTAELALDAHGNFLAVRVTGYGNLGAALQRARAGDQQRGQEHARGL